MWSLSPEDEVIPLPISVDEAIRFSISGGVLVPASEAQESTGVHFRAKEVAGISRPADRE